MAGKMALSKAGSDVTKRAEDVRRFYEPPMILYLDMNYYRYLWVMIQKYELNMYTNALTLIEPVSTSELNFEVV